MPQAGAQAVMPKYHAVIYLRGTQEKQLDDAERRCCESASRFGWQVLETIGDNGTSTTPGQIVTAGYLVHPITNPPRP